LANLSTPESEEEIVSIVQDAYKNNRKIRVVGDGHSWSLIAQTQDIMLSLNKYTGIVTSDKQNMIVTVKAGTPLEQVSEELDKLGLGMINLGSVAGQSVAGAISTGKKIMDLYYTHLCMCICDRISENGSKSHISVISIYLLQ